MDGDGVVRPHGDREAEGREVEAETLGGVAVLPLPLEAHAEVIAHVAAEPDAQIDADRRG